MTPSVVRLAVVVATISGGLYVKERGARLAAEQRLEGEKHQREKHQREKHQPTVEAKCVPTPLQAIARFKQASLMQTDKVTAHGYHIQYGPFLAPLSHRPVRVLEIGVQDGKSLGLWQVRMQRDRADAYLDPTLSQCIVAAPLPSIRPHLCDRLRPGLGRL